MFHGTLVSFDILVDKKKVHSLIIRYMKILCPLTYENYSVLFNLDNIMLPTQARLDFR